MQREGIKMCVTIDDKTKKVIEEALKDGFVVELFKKPDGSIKARTVRRKDIKIE